MKKALAAIMLLALAYWLYPCPPKVAAQEISIETKHILDASSLRPVYQPTPTQHTDASEVGTGKPNTKAKTRISSGRHNTRSETKISEDALRNYLQMRGSPLAPFAAQLGQSPYWSTIIGICTIEQYNCTHAPYNNYWGLMKHGGGLQHFATLEDGIAAIDAFLAKGEANHPTIESMRGWYCASACTNWEPTVIRVKTQLEQLK